MTQMWKIKRLQRINGKGLQSFNSFNKQTESDFIN